VNGFTIEKSPKREEINKGNNFENQYDQLARNPLGDSKVHNEIKYGIANQGMSNIPRLDTGTGFLRQEKSINPLEENLKERDRYVVCGTFGRDVDKTVAKGQAALGMAGYDLGEYGYKGVDGINGQLTKKALTEFQTAVGLKPTGEFDQDTMKALDLVAATKLKREEIEAIGKKVMQAQTIEKPIAPKQPEIKPLSPEEMTPEAKKRLADRDAKIEQIDFKETKGNYQFAQAEALLEMFGYKNSKPIDGKPDGQTFENIKQFQKDNSLPVTGKLDPDTYYMLERKVATGWLRPGLEKPRSNDKVIYNDNLRKAREKEAPIADPNKDIQNKLKGMGFDIGKAGVDGKIGNTTKGAIRQFQETFGLPVTGELDQTTRDRITGEYLKGAVLKVDFERKNENQSSHTFSTGERLTRKPIDGVAILNIDKEKTFPIVVRSDVANSLTTAVTEINALGGKVVSAGGMRNLSVSGGSGRSKTSLHYLGLAFDLATNCGMRNPEKDLYVIVRSGGTDQNPRWIVYCRSESPDAKEITLNAAVYKKGIGIQEQKVTGKFINVTEIMEKNGWKPISARSNWKNNYMSCEWWHFEKTDSLKKGKTTFKSELEKLYDQETINKNFSGDRASYLNYIWGNGFFTRPK